MQSAVVPLKSAFAAALVVWAACSACHGTTREEARAVDEWTRSYPLAAGGRVTINNRKGAVAIEGVEGATVEIRAERVVRAPTAKTAADLLPKVRIAEDIKPDLVAVRNEGIEGVLLGVSFEVSFRVRVPKTASVRVQTDGGDITVTDISGRLVANNANGTIKADNLRGGVESRNVNGAISVNLSALGADPIVLRTTNGPLALTLPASSNANLMATTTNGNLTLTGLTVERTGEPGPERGANRRLRGRLNAGGTSIELQTVNGSIDVSAAAPSSGRQD